MLNPGQHTWPLWPHGWQIAPSHEPPNPHGPDALDGGQQSDPIVPHCAVDTSSQICVPRLQAPPL
jgi:hypothetical protein